MRIVLLYILIIYCFTFGILSREIGGLSYGLFIEVFLILIWIGILIKTPKEHWKSLNSDLIYLFLFWLVISILEVANPGASVMGWLQEIRSAALYPILIISVGFLILRENKNLDTFLVIIIAASVLASINGVKQLVIGPSRGEQMFLDSGGAITHMLWGRLRVFSFYSDAGQFGASQAHIGLIALILSLGNFKKWKKIVLMICSLLMLYGMLISGTRGALFALVIGAFVAIVLTKKFKVLIVGGLFAFAFLFFLKFTYIGNSNYQIYRLRSALNPDDPSLNVRFKTQQELKSYMESRPFGGGLGVIGAFGVQYNQDKYLSTVQPDSYFVKIWAMYGVVGLTIWLGIMLYILGKACGIAWNLQDESLKLKIIALTAGYAGILFSSYGNEVINTMPSSIVVYLSWVLIFSSPELQKKEKSEILN
ncbi:O-antigen ligase family protein [Pedobacter sp. CCM 8938]|uniref:O-antigen ligase family protein n=1 Tax=Pedobacter fastidiosus TaxID=2765361 RepID=A0ABR7KVN8_9SPHI|nr:O-antigen ligase family protein [Pedobacter fastidiosus]MBC6112127.1 O-antigen ligase family protein [Pedobacter fastidiosus]